jgi:predicted RNA-binding Zn-ribbon protein involved in translation (DUF1610 family)
MARMPFYVETTMQTCPKCQYQRKPGDEAPDWQCPSCGIAYAKYSEAQHGGNPARRRVASPVADTGSNLKIALAGGFLIALIGFAVWKSQHKAPVIAAVSGSAQFDEARKAYDANLYEDAIKGFAPLADAGNARAQYYVAMIYGVTWTDSVNGVQHRADSTMQIQWFTRSAQQGEVLAQTALAQLYDRAAPETAYSSSVTQWNQAPADAGYAEAQYPLATDFGQDTFTPADVLQDAALPQHVVHQRSHPGILSVENSVLQGTRNHQR